MDEYYRAVKALPAWLAAPLAQLPAQTAVRVQELRLRIGCAVTFTVQGRQCAASVLPGCPPALAAMRLDALQIEEIFYTLCNGSVHTHERELAEGYLTTAAGNRVGVAGQFVQREGQSIALQKVTSLNLRIARSCAICLPPELDKLLEQHFTGLLVVGEPGSGKTTVGEALSRLTGREAVDLDQMIETTAGCSIPEIFQREGESGFRARERAAAEEAGKRTGVILLTGGGIIKTAENYAALHQNGRIYQLVRDLSLLPTEGRPLSQGADLAAMWRERAPLYARFRDVEIDNSGTVEDTAAAIWRDFCAHSGS